MLKKGKEYLRRLARFAEETLFPRAGCCLSCGDPRRADKDTCLCPFCTEKLKRETVPDGACPRCLQPLKKGKPCAFCRSPMMRSLKNVYAPYIYADVSRRLIHQLKFNACEEAVPLLSTAMARALNQRDFDCICPVPLHPRRLRQRGFNQSLLLARALSEETGIPVLELLSRNVYRRPQSLSDRKERQENVRGVFACQKDPAGFRVLLLDDVRTSGATAQACAEALLKSGADSVSLCAAAVVYKKK